MKPTYLLDEIIAKKMKSLENWKVPKDESLEGAFHKISPNYCKKI